MLPDFPSPRGREAWLFLEELKQPFEYRVQWTAGAEPGDHELDLRQGIRFQPEFPDAGPLETANRVFRSFLAKLPEGGFPVRTLQCGELSGEDYRFRITEQEICIEAGDAEGIRRGIYAFIDELRGNRGPFVEKGERTFRHWLGNRISRCFFGPIKRAPFFRDELMDEMDYYPDEYLNRLAGEGVNGLWLTIAFRDLCRTSFCPPSPDRERRLAKLRDTVSRCLRYGIRTWAFCIEPTGLFPGDILLEKHPELKGAPTWDRFAFCPSTESGRQYIYESVKDLFTQVPKLGGILNISYGERPTTCLSSANVVNESPVKCPRCAAVPKWEILFRSLSAMRSGMPESAQLISWLYMARPTSRSEWVFRIAEHTPENVILQYNLESNGTKMQLGKPRKGVDYWLSYTGPSQDFREIAGRAAKAGTALSAKIQVGCSHEVATVPFVPVPGLLYRKYREMKLCGVSSVMQCWYFGNYPGLMNRAAGMLAREDFANSDEDDFLVRLARPEWGEKAPAVAAAWKMLGDAYENYPLDNMMQYYGPMHSGVIWPLFPEIALKPLAPTWKPDFGYSGDVIGECLGNHTLEEAVILTRRMADGWEKGLKLWQSCGSHPDIGVAEALSIQFRSASDILNFYLLREKLIAGIRPATTLDAMEEIVRREIGNSERLIPLCKADSRLGFHSEAESHQYDPDRLHWRISQLKNLLLHDFPAIRRNHCIPRSAEVPSYRGGWIAVGTMRWCAEWKQDGLHFRLQCRENADCETDKVLIATLNRPATGMPWLVEAFSDGRKTDNRGGSEVQISRRPGGWDAEVFLPCSRRADDRMKLPFYFLLIRQNQTIGKEDMNYCWPPSRVVPRLRLNFSIYSPENFGCFPENNG